MRKQRCRAWFGLITVGAIVLGSVITPSVANAASVASSHNDRMAALVDELAPDIGPVDEQAAPYDETTDIVRVGAGPDEPGLRVRVPDAAGPAGRAADGTMIVRAHDPATSIAVQEMESGAVRVQTVLESAAAPRTFSYSFDADFQPVQAADGSFWIVGFDPDGEMQAYEVHDAWARDADGAEVATHYEIEGDRLIQVVEPGADTSYPIVADPTWQWYAAAYGAGFSKKETKTLAGLGAGAGFCQALPAQLRAVCYVAVAQWVVQANFAASAKGCVFIAAVPAPLAVRWNSSQCR